MSLPLRVLLAAATATAVCCTAAWAQVKRTRGPILQWIETSLCIVCSTKCEQLRSELLQHTESSVLISCAQHSIARMSCVGKVSLFGGLLSGPVADSLVNFGLESASTSCEDTSDDEVLQPKRSRKRKLSSTAANNRAQLSNKRCTTSYVSCCDLPTDKGFFRLRAYRHEGRKSHEPVVMCAGDCSGEGVHVRVHDQCQTSEVLGSRRCDCREQLDLALRHIQQHGGAVIYLQQEGRGIGLANKVAAYALQDGGLDTVDANLQLGFAEDERSYECVPFILQDMGIKSVKLMTNNPFKVESLRALGVAVEGCVPVIAPRNTDNARYIDTKVQRMSHLINSL
jgi:GTP cyclohydrolase II